MGQVVYLPRFDEPTKWFSGDSKLDKPSVIQSSFYAPQWKLKLEDGGKEKTSLIRFDRQLFDGSFLTDETHSSALNAIKAMICLYANYPSVVGCRSVSLAGLSKNTDLLIHSYQFLLQQKKSFSDVNLSTYKEICELYASGGVSGLLGVATRTDILIGFYEKNPSLFEKIRDSAKKDITGNSTVAHFLNPTFDGEPVIRNSHITSKQHSYCEYSVYRLHKFLLENGVRTKTNSDVEFNNQEVPERLSPVSDDSIRKFMQATHRFSVVSRYGLAGFAEPFFVSEAERLQHVATLYKRYNSQHIKNKTKTIPAQVALELIDKALGLVHIGSSVLTPQLEAVEDAYKEAGKQENTQDGLKYHLGNLFRENLQKTIDQLIDKMNLNLNFKVGPRVRRGQNDMSIDELFNQVFPQCCLIVIAAFTGRREDEILELRVDCLKQNGIEIWHEKGQDYFGVDPSCEAIEMAVNAMIEFGEGARKELDSDKLFCVYDFTSDKKTAKLFSPDSCKITVKLCEILSVIHDNKPWELAEHQFRRFFAITYLYRYKNAKLPALSYHLRHFSIRMTLEYVRGSVGGQIFEEVASEKLDDVFSGISLKLDNNSVSKTYGGFARRYKSELKLYVINRSRALDSVKLNEIADSVGSRNEVVHQLLEELSHSEQTQMISDFKAEMLERYLPYVRHEHSGLCVGEHPLKTKSAKCAEKGRIRPDKANVDMCDGCANRLVTDEDLEEGTLKASGWDKVIVIFDESDSKPNPNPFSESIRNAQQRKYSRKARFKKGGKFA